MNFTSYKVIFKLQDILLLVGLPEGLLMLTKAIYTFRKAVFIQLVSHTIEKEVLICFTLIKGSRTTG